MKKENYSFKQACAVVGGQSAMARLLGVSPPSVNQWIKGVRQLPAERCPAIERATRGEVLCEDHKRLMSWLHCLVPHHAKWLQRWQWQSAKVV
ncbi:helix-turn-helix domain-containing protein [Escherichia coli]|uniref:helix-turn-helix domain-containing protein n=1 Tax=Escherichia coli TaxID=562 RepID=UPI003904CFBB